MKPFNDSPPPRSAPLPNRQDLSLYDSRRQGVEISEDRYLSLGIAKTTSGYFPDSQEVPVLNLGQDSHWALEVIGFSEDMQTPPDAEFYSVFETKVVSVFNSLSEIGTVHSPTIDPIRFAEFLSSQAPFVEGISSNSLATFSPFQDRESTFGELMTSDMKADYIQARSTLKPSDDNAVPFGYVVYGANGVPY